MKGDRIKYPNLWLMAAAFFSHLPALFIPFLHTDEGVFITLSKYIFSGELYSQITDHKPPFLFEFTWLLSLGARSMEALHFFLGLWSGVGAVLFFSLLKFYLTEVTAFFGAMLFALLLGVINQGGLTPERAFLPFVILSVWFAALAIRNARYSMGLSFLSGLGMGAAVGIKQTALLIGLASVLILIKSRYRFQYLFTYLMGALIFTAFSWWITGVPFDLIFRQGYLANFSVIGVQFQHPESFRGWGYLNNFLFIFGWIFLPLTVGFLLACLKIVKHRDIFVTNRWPLLLFFASFAGAILAFVMSGRYSQNYFLSLLPCLCLVTALSVRPHLRSLWLSVSFLIVFIMSSRTVLMQWSDGNKNWDSQVKQVIDVIEKTTNSKDTIWITNAAPSIYFMANRRPAVSAIVIMHMMGYIDLCRSDETLIRENLTDENYRRSLLELAEHKPAVIFWVNRPVNTCSDRIKLENFPALAQILAADYQQEWSNRLGIFYRRRVM